MITSQEWTVLLISNWPKCKRELKIKFLLQCCSSSSVISLWDYKDLKDMSSTSSSSCKGKPLVPAKNILNLSFDFQRGLSWPGQMSLTEPTSVWYSQLCLIGVCFSNFLCLKHALAECLFDLPLFHIHMKWEVQMQMHFPHLKLAKHHVPKFQEMLPLNALLTFGIETLEWVILAQTSNMVDYC